MRRQSTPRRIAGASLALALIGAGVVLPSAANAAPAANPAPSVFTSTGSFSGVVPDGACAVTAVVLGGAGGSAMSTTTVSPNGAGARVSATYDVLPGTTFLGAVGGGGQEPGPSAEPGGLGGVNGGGAGGSSGPVGQIRHAGAGGGGASTLTLGGTLAVVAGGGGGSGGGHSQTGAGVGGDAGLPTAAGVAAGSNGANGKDDPVGITVSGGQGGQAAAGGAAGTNSSLAAASGTSGSYLQGGVGGPDTNPDAAGGGGAGYFGGGGGASTVVYNSQNGASQISGSGGGGGSSYVAGSVGYSTITAPVSAVDSAYGARRAAGTAGNGADGSVTLNWVPCDYDLGVNKTVSAGSTTIGDTITWTVAITNLGPDAMTKGDTVTLTDTLPGSGAKTITSISTTGGSNSVLARGAVTCSAGVGSAMPGSLECSRPYQVGAGAPSGERGLDVGETLTIAYQQVAAGAVGAVLENTAMVSDRGTNTTNDTDVATTTLVADPPSAVNDSDLGNTIGDSVPVSVLVNDSGTGIAGSVTLWDPVTSQPITSPLVVTGQGQWTVEAGGVIRFTPELGYEGDPTPVSYQITDSNGLTDTATVTVTYVPVAVDDDDLNNTLGDTVTVDVLSNDIGDMVASSVRILDGLGNPVTSLLVPTEGTWTVNTTTGAISFAPLAGFTGDPTPITYEVTDTTGDTVDAEVTISYLPVASNDSSTGNAAGTPVSVDVVGNDTGIFDPTSVKIVHPVSGALVTQLVVAGEGTWSVNPVTGVITFTPLASFHGNPTPITYQITDIDGDVTSALVTITYLQAAAGNLASAGAHAELPLQAAGVMLLLGLVLMLTRRKPGAHRA